VLALATPTDVTREFMTANDPRAAPLVERLWSTMPEMARPLPDVLGEVASPPRIALYHSESSPVDCAHAARVEGVPGVTTTVLPGRRHNVLLTMLADGSFDRALDELIA
jgi:hypothetical protein